MNIDDYNNTIEKGAQECVLTFRQMNVPLPLSPSAPTMRPEALTKSTTMVNQ